jgi:hypothetical protein
MGPIIYQGKTYWISEQGYRAFDRLMGRIMKGKLDWDHAAYHILRQEGVPEPLPRPEAPAIPSMRVYVEVAVDGDAQRAIGRLYHRKRVATYRACKRYLEEMARGALAELVLKNPPRAGRSKPRTASATSPKKGASTP